MSKTLKIIAIALAVLIGVLLIAVAIIAATFDPNDYKPTIIKMVAEKKQRTLAIPGDIKLSFFPKLGADLGQVSISERNSDAQFASIEQATVSVALMPLLRKEVIVDRVSIDGLKASIRRHQDGSTNFDDLLAKDEPQQPQDAQQQPVNLDIDGIDIANAQIRFDDRLEQRTIELRDLDLETGQIASGKPSKLNFNAQVISSKPAVDARVAIDTGFTFDLDNQHFSLRDTDAKINGKLLEFADAMVQFAGNADIKPADKRIALDGVKFSASGKRAAQALELRIEAPKLAVTDAAVTGGKLQGDAKFIEGQRTVTASFSAPSFEGSPQAFKIPSVALTANLKEGELDATAKLDGSIAGDIDKLLFSSPQLKLALSGRQGDTKIDGTVATPLSVNLKTQLIDLPNIVVNAALPNPGGGALKLNANGRTSVNLAKSSLTSAFKGKLDESSFDAKFNMPSFSPAAYNFDVDIDRLDLDRYRSKAAAGNAGGQASPASKQGGQASQGANKPLDLSGLRDLKANGNLRVGNLKVNNIKASNVRTELRAGGGKIELPTLAANLYGGSANGSMSATASAAPRFTLRQNLANINVGPLLKDAIDKNPIDGRGNVSLDVTSAGGSFDQIKRSIDGNARLELRDGAVHGVNVAQAIRNAKSTIGELRGKEAPQTGTASTTEKTDFSELSGSFKITDGVARNDDLSLKSPLMRVGGAGTVDLGNERLDYLVKATVVSTLQGQGGPELQSLKGLTVPVRLTGPFTAINWRVDFEGLVKEAAKQKIDEKKDEIKAKAREEIGKQLKGLFGK